MNLLILVITIDPSECVCLQCSHRSQYGSKFIRRMHLILIYCEKCEQKCDILPIKNVRRFFLSSLCAMCDVYAVCGARVCLHERVLCICGFLSLMISFGKYV